MFDARALLVGREIELADSACLERADQPVHAVEEYLRGWAARLPELHHPRRFAQEVNAQETSLRALGDAEIRRRMREVAARMRRQGFQDALLAQAFALAREAAGRTLGMRHYDVQLLAGRALLRGRIVEMATGEGKTLAATLAACAAAMTGASVHVVTVNDYLAGRDAANNAPLYTFFGLRVGVIQQEMPIGERCRQYACDVVHVANKELTFDYLKDQIALGDTFAAQGKLRRLADGQGMPAALLPGLHMAIVDEADSVLIDEARTPLIISETLPDELGAEVYQQALGIAKTLEAERHYRLRHRDLWLTPDGEAEVARAAAGFAGVWKSPLWRKELASQALSALHLFHIDQHYILAEGKVQIVDESTGRVMPDRSWERGLHQMIEAKEQCEITGQRRTLSQITYQRFFRRYLLLAGMTGTAREVATELKRVYDLCVTRIPPHKPSRRQRLPDRVFCTSAARWQAVAERAREIAGEGRAVLVGTRSVAASEHLGRLLAGQGIPHTLLNARQDKEEAAAVARAGQPGRITVATNMAGRGTDIRLAPEVEEKGGLHVILTEFHESARIDRQLFGRTARQGSPGTVEAIVSLEDALFQRFIPWFHKTGKVACLRSFLDHGLLFRALTAFVQARAEAHDRRIRLDTVRRDRKWLQALGFVGRHQK
ncbi:MAG: preprotein translocase subunit SecA [Zoogloeaceae bacterium]|jgi:preprotein translocase subunit SecA|nr:preprotein translocase subunit SecA [Zoogloeaceae bacterium]